jgi:hypothetical protein
VSAIVEPVLNHAAAERARLVNDARATLLRSGGAVTVELLAESTHRSVEATRQWLRRQRLAQRIVTVTHDGNVLVPTFQLDEAFGLDDEVADIVRRLVEHGMSAWAVWGWFATPNTWLGNITPESTAASGRAEALRSAVDGLFQE